MGAPAASPARRLRIRVRGAVQGVGMRPFLYRTATELGLAGWIRNDTRGVILEVEGAPAALRHFAERLRTAPPPRAVIKDVEAEWLEPAGLTGLRILHSDADGDREAAVLPDLATCPACLSDIGLDGQAGDRRMAYAFTNCTDCGPRFSILRALPYDRPNTTMAGFELCPACRAEYEDPLDRRFHAQPTACPACGPRLYRLPATRKPRAAAPPDLGDGGDGGRPHPASPPDMGDGGEGERLEVVRDAAEEIRAGGVAAVKGLGGFHLVVDAGDAAAVGRLRARKHRPTKPLAVMVRDLEMARALVRVSPEAGALLASPEAPIVLLPKLADAPVADAVAPGNPYLGVMMPYTPLHHLLLRELDRPVVATSGNLSDEPICIDEAEAAERLAGIADAFLVHDRPIERPVDDSVIQWMAGAPRTVRRSRGYAPLPVGVPAALPPTLAVGGHLKNTIALARGTDVFLSQHIGDLETPQARDAFERVIADFLRLYEVEPALLAHDLHPDYASTTWALDDDALAAAGLDRPPRRIAVQHHHAHLASCLADNEFEGSALGVVWDGTGLGPDGTVWGGEFLLGDAGGYRRVAHLRPFRLPGGDAAVKAPWRVAVALAAEGLGLDPAAADRPGFGLGVGTGESEAERAVLVRMLGSGLRSPWTTSAGRLFDGVAALLGVRQQAGFEGEAAMALEFAVDPAESGSYRFDVIDGPEGALVVDWAPALDSLLADRAGGSGVGAMAGRFHNGLVDAILEVAERVGERAVALTGGCFQNVVLAERTAAAAAGRGMKPLLHARVPANDGGLALGQVAVAARGGDG
jgi:hydrogenase maturation protein HypF